MIKVSKEKWDSIHTDYKGIWQDYYNEKPEWKGKRVVMSGCINPNELGKLLVEDVHFVIVAYTEYAVEINNDRGFVKQIDIFNTYEEAENFINNYKEPLNEEEYLNIIFIDYDKNDNEIDFGTVC